MDQQEWVGARQLRCNRGTPVINGELAGATWLWTLPYTNSYVSTEKHVQQVFYFMCYFEAEPFTDDDMPRGAEFFVHSLFDKLGSILQSKTR